MVIVGRLGRSPNQQRRECIPALPPPTAVWLARVGLWALVALGAGGGLVAALRPTPAGPSRVEPQPAVHAPPHVVGVAQLAVRRWLTASDAGAGTPTALGGRGDGQARERHDVVFATAVDSRRIEDNYWAVTVAAQVRPAMGPESDEELWFLEVGVVDAPEGSTPVGTPALVPEPPGPPSPRLPGPALAVPAPGDPLAATAGSFLRALLTGAGEVSRYLAPGAAVAPVVPPPFTALAVERTATVEAGANRAVLRAEALATRPSGDQLRLVYELALEERAGRWELRRLSGAPMLRREEGAWPPPPGADPSPTAPRAPPSRAARRRPAPDTADTKGAVPV